MQQTQSNTKNHNPNRNQIPVIALDGPTSSGKGTIGKLLAEKLGWHFLDSGILYRVLALAALQKNIDPANHYALEALAAGLQVDFINEIGKPQQVIYQGHDVSTAIRQEGCGTYASQVAILPAVRNALFSCFQRLRTYPGLVADGRDMGTVVFPDAILKIFLTASEEERSQRRWQQLQNRGMNVSLHDVAVELRARDGRDAGRAVAPLKPAFDAKIIDTTAMSVDEVLQEILKLLP